MRLKRLLLRNFGLYRGEQIVDFQPRTKYGRIRPIVLVGGHNGAGKTTILEAVRLCLYGRLALGARITDTEYQTHLRERIHRGRDLLLPAAYASVGLEFDYAHSGKRSTYSVLRAWETKGNNGVSEAVRVLRDGEPLADVESQFWPDFVRSLIPPGVAQLFFFDGEKIKRLAEEESEADTLAESVKALLGLDLVERLQADLDHSSRHLKKTATGVHAVRLGEIAHKEIELREQLESARRDLEELRTRSDSATDQIGRLEQQLAQSGEGLAAQRGELRQRKTELARRLEETKKALRELCEGPLPFAVCRKLSAETKTQLELEGQRQQWDASRREVHRALDLVSAQLTEGALAEQLKWTEKTRKVVKETVLVLRDELDLPPPRVAAVELIHEVSDLERNHLQHVLSEALDAIPSRAAQFSTELLAIEAELTDVQSMINRAPESDEIAPLVRQLSALQEQHANLVLEVTLKTEESARLERELAALLREQEKIHQAERGAQSASQRLLLASKARVALNDYLVRLTVAKVEQLQTVAMSCFQQLCRKNDLVRELRINPTTFRVSLMDEHAVEIPKSSLSAGEKQIYAIALLWALAKVSGRPLPMIIDTPLGRLDSVHRQNLLQRYFPFASHQVIILSTDTEVDKSYFELLKPHTSHSIHLANQGAWTEVTAGYFWKEEAHASAPA